MKITVKKLLNIDNAAKNQLCTITSNLLFRRNDKKIIAVSSCDVGNGKTFTALHIAYALAQGGFKAVIATDNDEGIFNAPSCKGQMYKIFGTDMENLDIALSNELFKVDTLALKTDRISQMLEDLSCEYDFIFVDTPAALVNANAAKIASLCDGVILVAEYNRTTKRDIRNLIDIFSNKAGCDILGCIINKVRFDRIQTKKEYRTYYTSFLKRLFKKWKN